jgi:hypothetical protein
MADPNHSGQFVFGATHGVPGGTSLFASGGQGMLSLSNGALTFSGTVEPPTGSVGFPYSGFALYFDGPRCVNANIYQAVEFTLTVTGTCQAVLMFADSDHLKPTDDPDRGACAAASCYPSQFLVDSSTFDVSFNATPASPGSPTATIDTAKLTGVQWQLYPVGNATMSTGCSGTITVDNVSFF